MFGSVGRLVLGLPALALSVAGAAAAALVLLPPPGVRAWLPRLLLTEWSLLLIPPAVLGLLLALATWWAGARRTGFVAALLASLTIVAAAVQPARGAISASDHGVVPDLLGYFAGPSYGEARPYETRRYATVDGRPLRLDVWTPQELRRSHPAVILVHGGGWVAGQRSARPQWDRWFTEQGFVAFDIDYRLARAGRPTWRQAPGDVACAVSWVRRNAARYGVDPDRLVLAGWSAGGQLALLAAYAGHEFPSTCPRAGDDPTAGRTPPVSRVIALYPPTHLAALATDPRPRWHTDLHHRVQAYLRGHIGDTPSDRPEAYRAADPATYVRPGLPPTMLVQGGADYLVPPQYGRRMAQALERAGGGHRYVEIAYAGHGFDVSWGGFGTQVTRHAVTEFLAPLRPPAS